ncbi:MAG: hypothetical protein E6G50_09645, partial [Actinobacteria bacterium]
MGRLEDDGGAVRLGRARHVHGQSRRRGVPRPRRSADEPSNRARDRGGIRRGDPRDVRARSVEQDAPRDRVDRAVDDQARRSFRPARLTLLAEVVAASNEVAATSARSRKIAILADLLRRLEPAEVPIATGFLSGAPRQGRVGVGYSSVYAIDATAAASPSLTVDELDRAISQVEATTGGGSAGRRRELLSQLLVRATADEAGFVRRLFTGELRQGALAGLMVDAIAKAAGVPAEMTRRALMLSGDLPRTAELAMTTGEDGLRSVGFELFRPILPMLASTAGGVADALAGFDSASVEWKLDGIRIQIHRRDEDVRIYTRNLNDITHALPGIVDAVRALPVRQTVLDGEALWMHDDGPATVQE